MITRGIIERIEEDSDVLRYQVRLPLFNGSSSAPGSTPSEELLWAVYSSVAGLTGTVNVGDSVFVGFEDNDLSKPLILGSLTSTPTYVAFTGQSLNVIGNTKLSEFTQIGDITYDMLFGVVRWWRNYTGGGGGETADVAYITLLTPTGTLSQRDLSALANNNLSQLVYNGCYYRLAYLDSSTRRYATDVLAQGGTQYIDVNLNTRVWTYKTVGRPELQAHINDSTAHIQSGERDYWNDKITCALDGTNTERLVFTKNNLL